MTQIALRKGQTLITGGERHDREMGAQLTSQYERATGGMREVLRFGCMMLMLEADLVHRGQGDSNGVKGGGVKGWLEQYAPGVQRPTAYRFRDVARAVAQQFELPGRVAKALTFEQLVTANEKQLGPAERKAQSAAFEFVAGTSQKSWLDQFGEEKERGGDTSKSRKKKLTPAQEHELFLKTAREDFTAAFSRVDSLVLNGHWKAPSIRDAEIEETIELCERFTKEARAWLNTPKKERTKQEPTS